MSAAASISTLSEFLLQAHTQHIIFDVGRGIRKITNQRFFEWENQQAPCAFPRQDHAWFCIVFWNEKLNDQRYIWFIKLPLDENGLLISAALQQFLDIVAQALGKQLQHTQDAQAKLPENPYVFTPSQQQLALCNALIRKELNIQNAVKPEVLTYLQAPNAINDNRMWETLSLQDISNFIINPVSATGATNSQQTLIAKNMQAYAEPVQNALMASLEAVAVNDTLTNALLRLHHTYCHSKNTYLASLCLRALSFAPQALCNHYITQLILSASSAHPSLTNNKDVNTAQMPSLDADTCVVIAGRYWQILQDDSLLAAFMHQVAVIDGSFQIFKGLYTDLVKIPETRNALLRFIRNPERSAEVSRAIGALFAQTKI